MCFFDITIQVQGLIANDEILFSDFGLRPPELMELSCSRSDYKAVRVYLQMDGTICGGGTLTDEFSGQLYISGTAISNT